MILFANLQEQIKYQQNNSNSTNKKNTQIKTKNTMFENKIDIDFIRMFNFFNLKPTSMQALFHYCNFY